jgi:hypothetical protein
VTVGCIPIPDEIIGRFVPREGIVDLPSDPFRGWVIGDTERYQAPALVPQDDEREQQSEADRRHDHEVHRGNTGRVIAQERPPGLRRPSPAFGHVLGDPSTAQARTRA